MTNAMGKLLTPTKAAEIYGLDRNKIYWWIRKKRFDFIKPDKEILFWEKDLLDFLEGYKVPASSDLV